MRFIKAFAGIVLALSVTACAGQPKAVVQTPISFVSPIMYETFDCHQIGEEVKVLSGKLAAISGYSEEKINQPSAMIWPAGLRVEGTGSKKTELLKMRTQFEALERASEREKCSIQFMREPAGVDQKSAQTGWVTNLS